MAEEIQTDNKIFVDSVDGIGKVRQQIDYQSINFGENCHQQVNLCEYNITRVNDYKFLFSGVNIRV
ncbi:MAG: hypothetical protein K9I47_10485 [Bacteroidales bacterium]|nr:hypothetical protein [Bacteroidales bacterium]